MRYCLSVRVYIYKYIHTICIHIHIYIYADMHTYVHPSREASEEGGFEGHGGPGGPKYSRAELRAMREGPEVAKDSFVFGCVTCGHVGVDACIHTSVFVWLLVYEDWYFFAPHSSALYCSSLSSPSLGN